MVDFERVRGLKKREKTHRRSLVARYSDRAYQLLKVDSIQYDDNSRQMDNAKPWKVGCGDQGQVNTRTTKCTLWCLLVESTTGYAFWSLFHGLIPMIWFYPLNKLELTGYEAFGVALLIPGVVTLLIGGERVHSVLTKPYILVILRLATGASLAASFSLAHPYTLARLIIISGGLIMSLLVLQAFIWGDCTFKRWVVSLGLLVSYIALLVSRILYVSILPTWADFTTNAAVASFVCATTLAHALSRDDHIKTPVREMLFVNRNRDNGPWFRVGVGFGSFLYLTHSVFGEVTVPCRWVSFNNTHLAGCLILAAIVLGLCLTHFMPDIASSFLWWLFGGLACVACLIFLPTYYGLAGVIVLAVYVFSVWPLFWLLVSQRAPGHVMTVAMATYIIEMLFSIWAIAYNFVPGGQLTREQTPVLMTFVILTIGAALLVDREENVPEMSLFCREPYLHKRGRFVVLLVVSLLVCLGILSLALRFHRHKPHLSAAEPHDVVLNDFNALVWTYHFGYDNVGWPSFERTAILLRDTGADVIGLLETDASKPFMGNNDIAMWLSERLSMHVDFGPSTRDHTWGSVLLSRHPIVATRRHLLPSPEGELAPAVSATVNISGQLVDFVTAHMGNHRDSRDRKLQAEYLANLVSNSENPVVFIGYLTSSPGSRDYKRLIETGSLKDIDLEDNNRWCEYIMYRGLVRLGYARLSRGMLSDTELQMAKFRVPKRKRFRDNDRREIDESRVPPEQLFTHKFGTYFAGEYHGDDHHYHMDTPRYYLPIRQGFN